MSKLPVVSAKELLKFFYKLEYVFVHHKGSHVTLHNDVFGRNVTIPLHREVSKGTLMSIIRQSGLTRDQFVHLYERLK